MIGGLRDWLHRRRHPTRFALLDDLLRNQALSREQLLRKQQEDLARIIEFATANTAYYARRFAGIAGRGEPRSGGSVLHDLPVLSKAEVIANLDAMLARGVDRSQAHLGHTGGSTGEPLAYYWDAAKHELMRAGMMRSYMGAGWRPGQKIVNFWGARHDLRRDGLAKRYGEIITAEKTLGAREVSEPRLREWAAFVQAWEPVLLQGYASILAALARFVLDNRMAMPATLLGVYSTAEVLSDGQREAIERAFGCKVFNQYGSREVPNIACECRQGNMHVFTDMVYLESQDIDGEDRLLVTSLTNRLMPFIRYDIGDSGRLAAGDCDCGWSFPLMEMGMCRQNDFVRTRGGKRIHPSYFNRLLSGMSQIRQYQVVQNDLDRLVLNLVTSPRLGDDAINVLAERIRHEVDAGMALEVHHVAEILPTASGKHRFVISEAA